MEYELIPVTKFHEVITFLNLNFNDEPMTSSVGIYNDREPCKFLDDYFLVSLQEKMSIMAVDRQSGEILGVALIAPLKRGYDEKAVECDKAIKDIQYRRVFGLLNIINRDLDLYSKYNVDELVDIRIVSVNSKHRGKGIGRELFIRSIQLAEEHDFKLVKVDATSFFSQQILNKLGFIEEACHRYSDFVDENGKRIYNTKPPHTFYKVLTKQL